MAEADNSLMLTILREILGAYTYRLRTTLLQVVDLLRRHDRRPGKNRTLK